MILGASDTVLARHCIRALPVVTLIASSFHPIK